MFGRFFKKNKKSYQDKIKQCNNLIINWGGCLANVDRIYKDIVEESLNAVLKSIDSHHDVVKITDAEYGAVYHGLNLESIGVVSMNVYSRGVKIDDEAIKSFVRYSSSILKSRLELEDVELNRDIVDIIEKAAKSGKNVYVFTNKPNLSPLIKKTLLSHGLEDCVKDVWSNDTNLATTDSLVDQMKFKFSLFDAADTCVIDDSKFLGDFESLGFKVVGVKNYFSLLNVVKIDDSNLIETSF